MGVEFEDFDDGLDKPVISDEDLAMDDEPVQQPKPTPKVETKPIKVEVSQPKPVKVETKPTKVNASASQWKETLDDLEELEEFLQEDKTEDIDLEWLDKLE